jgi:hypothetical protein
MLRTLTALSALAILLAAPASADIRLEGNIEFTKKTNACPDSIKLNTQWRSRYHPGNTLAPGNNDYTGINRIEDFAAQGWGKDGDFSTSFENVRFGTLTDRFTGSILYPPANKSKLKLNALPATIDASTQTTILRGQIKNPLGKDGQSQCVVDFVGIYENPDYAAP